MRAPHPSISPGPFVLLFFFFFFFVFFFFFFFSAFTPLRSFFLGLACVSFSGLIQRRVCSGSGSAAAVAHLLASQAEVEAMKWESLKREVEARAGRRGARRGEEEVLEPEGTGLLRFVNLEDSNGLSPLHHAWCFLPSPWPPTRSVSDHSDAAVGAVGTV
jgi:hypothetical protein